MKKILFVLFVLYIALAHPISVQSKTHKEIEELFGEDEEIEVIVALKGDYDVIQSEDYGIELTNAYSTVNGFSGKLKKSKFQKLKNNPRVEGIYKSRNISAFLSDSTKIIGATRVWKLVYNGTNVTGKAESVCVIDSGVDYTHDALGKCSPGNFKNGKCQKVISGYDFVNNDDNPIDDNGHGTHVAGIIASTDSTYRGVAPDVTIVAIKVLNSAGSGSDANLISGIDWCVNNASIFNISVISMSLGVTGYSNSTYCDTSDNPLLVDAVHNAINKNISVIVAAGNDAVLNGVSSPACISNVTVVSSTTKSDEISSFSNTWDLPMLLAPGSSIKSLKASGNCLSGCSCDGNFATCSGTSMATPHVAGAFALLRQYKKLEQNIALTPSQIQSTLNDTGKQINGTGSGLFYSRINAFSALSSLDKTAPNISFVPPTPTNNSKISKNFVFINLTSNEVLLNATLEWNGTNETIDGYGLNWFKNKTALSNINATYSFKVYANDSGGNIKSTGLIVLTIHNSAPEIISFAPNESQLNVAEPTNQTFNISWNDLNNDTVTANWYQNGSVKAINSNFSIGGNFSSAGAYNITVVVSDGNLSASLQWNLTINNSNRAVDITLFTPASLNLKIAAPNNQTFRITYSDLDDDTITITWFQNGTNKSAEDKFTLLGNSTAVGFYNITVIVSDGYSLATNSWNLTVYNPAPNITSVNLTNADFLNRTNGSLIASWGFSDFDNAVIIANETSWYVNNALMLIYANKTFIPPLNTTRLENWTFSVRVFNGFDWSDFVNSSTIKILNSIPIINTANLSITVLETQLVNISLNVSDLDNDILSYTTNISEFIISDSALLWYTNLTNSGNYVINITVNDSIDVDSTIVNVAIIDARDLDNDGNPDFNESDDDNDGIADENDFLIGNLSLINTTSSLNIIINGTSNLSRLFNGTLFINITNGTLPIIEFNFTFNSSNILDLSNLTINRTINGSSAVSIRGRLSLLTAKRIYLEKINSTAKSVCIKDDDAGFDAISSACDSTNETLVNCNNVSSGQYSCFDTGTRYKITGLNHSAVKEQCRDNDGDGYGTGCSAGTDCNDNDKSKTTDCSSGSSGGSPGSGSSGGGGGGSFGYVCNMDWNCGEWTECVNGVQTRQCDFVKVPQHVRETQCPQQSNSPATSQKCEAVKQISLAAETCSDGVKNQSEEGIDCGGICKPCQLEENNLSAEIPQPKEELKQPIGFATKYISGKINYAAVAGIIIFIIVIVAALLIFRYYKILS